MQVTQISHTITEQFWRFLIGLYMKSLLGNRKKYTISKPDRDVSYCL